MRIALAGNPNSGKTTMYNVLTGKNEKVGNWAGVTVDKKEHALKKSLHSGRETVTVVDLPGAYSMSPFTSEENVTRDYVKNETPDVIINVVDATNLSRSLFFTTQLLELGIPVVVALNKTDANEKNHTSIDTALLSKKLGCAVVETSSSKARGVRELVSAALDSVGKTQTSLFVCPKFSHDDAESVRSCDKLRFEYVKSIVSDVELRTTDGSSTRAFDKLDSLLTSKWLGIPVFAAVMFAVFWISQSGPTVYFADLLTSLLENGKALVSDAIGNESIWSSMLIEGIIGGFIAIVGFLPLVMVMYFLIALLEDCGYMARATVVLDPIFKKVGLSGKSVIPFIVGTGCAVPGVMASRTIRDERERRATAMLAPFMPCGAKLPVISLFATSFFSNSPYIGALMYFAGIAIIFFCALIVKLITQTSKKKNYFIIELPDYKLPSLKKAAISMCQRGWSYIVKAGTVILVCNFVIHVMQTFDIRFQVAETASDSILALVASPFAYFIAPVVGVVAWQLAAASIAGFIAKENVVATLAVCYSITNLFNIDEMALSSGTESVFAAALGISAPAALAFLMFNLFTPPCFAAIGAMNAEMKSKKWLFAALGLQLSVGYSVGFLAFFFGSLVTGQSLGSPWMPVLGWIVEFVIVAVFTTLMLRNRRVVKQ